MIGNETPCAECARWKIMWFDAVMKKLLDRNLCDHHADQMLRELPANAVDENIPRALLIPKAVTVPCEWGRPLRNSS